jgi:hypothetical protein
VVIALALTARQISPQALGHGNRVLFDVPILLFGAPTNAHVALKSLVVAVGQAVQSHVESPARFRSESLATAGACHLVGLMPPAPAEYLLARRRIAEASEQTHRELLV